MRFVKQNTNVDFIGKRKLAYGVSLAMLLISLVSLVFHKGPRYGVDFVGGTILQIKFSGPTAIDIVKKGLAAAGIDKVSVQQFEDLEAHEFLIRTDVAIETAEEFTSRVQTALKSATGKAPEIQRIEMVGPQVGQDLRKKALFAVFFALLFITIYISGRFEFKWFISGVMAAVLIGAVYLLSLFKVSIPVLIAAALAVTLVLFWFLKLRYAMGAIVALIHDVTITVGIFSILEKEFTLPIIAALLTIIGYSLNDTIIVFDRIRENIRKYQKSSFETIVNRSINETLSRTILTAGTTLIVLSALFWLGGGIIHDFAFSMIVGVVVGTYSSIYVASPILLAMPEEGARRKT